MLVSGLEGSGTPPPPTPAECGGLSCCASFRKESEEQREIMGLKAYYKADS